MCGGPASQMGRVFVIRPSLSVVSQTLTHCTCNAEHQSATRRETAPAPLADVHCARSHHSHMAETIKTGLAALLARVVTLAVCVDDVHPAQVRHR